MHSVAVPPLPIDTLEPGDLIGQCQLLTLHKNECLFGREGIDVRQRRGSIGHGRMPEYDRAPTRLHGLHNRGRIIRRISLKIMLQPQLRQPLRYGGVWSPLIAWEIRLDIDDRCSVPEVQADDVQIVAIDPDQAGTADTDRIRTLGSARDE